MTPTEINALAESHLNNWFSADPVSNPTTLREHVAAAITEALERQAKLYADGDGTRQHEDSRRLDWLLAQPLGCNARRYLATRPAIDVAMAPIIHCAPGGDLSGCAP